MTDSPKEAAIGDKAARDLMLSELLQACTPAPWRFVGCELLEDESVYPSHITGGTANFLVCYMEGQTFAQLISDLPDSHAYAKRAVGGNAKLIALAPTIAAELIKERAVNAKLLEACKLADAVWEGANMNISTFERKLKDAIKLAEEL